MNISGKTALVTGASSGIGAATAIELARKGANLILLARREKELSQVSDECKKYGNKVHLFPVDLSSPSETEKTAEKIKKEVGIPDILINCAGAGKWRFSQETTTKSAINMMAVPYFAAFMITKSFLPEMVTRKSGHIVTITSINAFIAFSGSTAYTAARWAMRGFHEALSADLYQTGVNTTLAYYAKVESDYWIHNPGSEERLPKAHTLIRPLEPEEVAKSIVEGIIKNKRYVTTPFTMRMFMFINRLFPQTVRIFADITGYKLK